jgi:xanthosine utilization system XapX-like protein
MITYYRDPEVLVTSTGVRMAGREYRVADFTRVWHTRGRRSWGRVAGRGALALAIVTPVLVGALGILVALLIDASASTTIALVGGGVLVGLAAAPLADVLLEAVDRSYDRGSRSLEIWGRVRGSDVLLLHTDDAQRFGRIYRALQRALDGGSVPR